MYMELARSRARTDVDRQGSGLRAAIHRPSARTDLHCSALARTENLVLAPDSKEAARRPCRRRGHSVRAVVGRAQRTRRLRWFLVQEPNRNKTTACGRSVVSSERLWPRGIRSTNRRLHPLDRNPYLELKAKGRSPSCVWQGG